MTPAGTSEQGPGGDAGRPSDYSAVPGETASASRIYDYLLGGSHHWAVDRDAVEKILEVYPRAAAAAQANRAFLRRAVRVMLENGVRQFLDLGSGIPTTVGNVHDVARAVDPDVTVVYVDTDPVAVQVGRALERREQAQHRRRVAMVGADLRDVDSVLRDPATTDLIDFDKPVGLLMVAVLHFVPDGDDPGRIIGRYRDVLAPGSLLAMSHACTDDRPELAEVVTDLDRQYRSATGVPVVARSVPQLYELTGRFGTVLPPGWMPTMLWRPEETIGRWSEELSGYGYASLTLRDD
jgi:SAM-dependent methyltransferase